MLQRFRKDKKKAKKIYRRRCYTEYWYLTLLIYTSFIVFVYSIVALNLVLIFISIFTFIVAICIRRHKAASNCKYKHIVDVTNEHMIIRWVDKEETFGYDSNFDYVHQKTRETNMKNVIPLESIHNLNIDKKTGRIEFDYNIHKSKACKTKNITANVAHILIFDIYDKSLADALLAQIANKQNITKSV